jgi:hypothetical protein
MGLPEDTLALRGRAFECIIPEGERQTAVAAGDLGAAEREAEGGIMLDLVVNDVLNSGEFGYSLTNNPR